jgi:hypothetical protein
MLSNELPRSKLRGIKSTYKEWAFRSKLRGINPDEIKIRLLSNFVFTVLSSEFLWGGYVFG